MRSLWLLLAVAFLAACSATKEAPRDETTHRDGLAQLGARFSAARAVLAEARPVAIRRDGARWHLREKLPPSSGPWRTTRRALAVEVDPSGGFTVRSRRGGALTVDRAAVGGIEAGADHLVLRDVDGSPTGAWLATPRGLEELVVGEGSLRYRLELPAGWRMRQPKGREELVELRDGRDVPQLRFVARWAFDEQGGRHRLVTRIDGDGIVVEAPSDEGPLLIDPEWQATDTPPHDPQGALTTMLANGDLLIVGGGPVPNVSAAAARFDPFTQVFEVLPSANLSRLLGTATLLHDGRVLLVGGFGVDGNLGGETPRTFSAELFDPASETFVESDVSFEPSAHTATRFDAGPHAGEVLIAGGFTDVPSENSAAAAELWWFDPTAKGGLGALEPAGSLAQARSSHRAVALPDGDVLFVGGFNGTATMNSVERYDPITATSQVVANLGTYQHGATALLLPHLGSAGRVLIAGGLADLMGGPVNDVSLYDLADDAVTSIGSVSPPRGSIVGSLLPTGDALLLAGGDSVTGASASGAERFDADDGTLLALPAPPGGFSVTTGMVLPSGEMLVLGAQDAAFVFEPEEHATIAVADTMAVAMSEPSVTVLSTGEALITEGGPAELFDPDTRTFSSLPGGLPGIGRWHRATRLLDGRVLFTGGLDESGLATYEAVIYDPATGGVAPTVTTMKRSRAAHSQTLLPNGDVLIAGGVTIWDEGNPVPALADVELFDDETETFTSLIPPAGNHVFGRAMLLADGKVWLWDGFEPLPLGVEATWTFDPITQTLTQLGAQGNPDPLNIVGGMAVGARIPDGRLFVVDETGTGKIVDVTGAVPTELLQGSLWPSAPPRPPALIPLPSGRLLLVDAEEQELHLVEPSRGEVTTIPEPAAARWMDAAALLPDGGVLLAGAIAGGPPSDTVSIWYERPARAGWRPRLDAFSSIGIGETTTLAGSGLLGISEGISATSMSPANAPVAFFLFEDGGMVRGPSTAWSEDALTWTTAPAAFPGTGMLWASTMGLHGGRAGALTPGSLGAACLSAASCDSGHCVDGVCCDSLCDGLCVACSAEAKGLSDGTQSGTCEPVQAGVAEPACEIDSVATCGQNGLCDATGQCATYPEGTLCNEAETQFCYQGGCVEQACDGDHTLIRAGEDLDCTPYRCVTEPADACLSQCDSTLDCVEGFVCSAAGDCVDPTPPADRLGCTPCALGAQRREDAAWAWLAGLAGLLGRRRRLSAGQFEAVRQQGG